MIKTIIKEGTMIDNTREMTMLEVKYFNGQIVYLDEYEIDDDGNINKEPARGVIKTLSEIADIYRDLDGKNHKVVYQGNDFISFDDFVKLKVDNDAEYVWVNFNGIQASTSILNVIDIETRPFEASETLEDDSEHDAWQLLYDDYLSQV